MRSAKNDQRPAIKPRRGVDGYRTTKRTTEPRRGDDDLTAKSKQVNNTS